MATNPTKKILCHLDNGAIRDNTVIPPSMHFTRVVSTLANMLRAKEFPSQNGIYGKPHNRIQLAVSRLPVFYPRSTPLTLGTSSFIHVGPICSIHIATNGTLGFECILPMAGSLNSAMTAALLAVRVEVANF